MRATAAIKEGLGSCCEPEEKPETPEHEDKELDDEDDQEFDFKTGDQPKKIVLNLERTLCEEEFNRFCKTDDTNKKLLHAFPVVRATFLKFNTLLPSSAPVERMFSFATMFDISKFNRLTDENFERRVLSRANCGAKST